MQRSHVRMNRGLLVALATSLVLISSSLAHAQQNGNGRGRAANPRLGVVVDAVDPAVTAAFDQLRRPGGAPGKNGRGRGGGTPEVDHSAGHFELIGGAWVDRLGGNGVVDPLLDFEIYLKGFPPGAEDALWEGFDVWQDETEGQLFNQWIVNDTDDAPNPYMADGANTVSLGNLGGSYLAVTYFWWNDVNGNGVPDSGEQYYEMDIVFSAQIAISTNLYTPTNNGGKVLKSYWDLQSVAAHEVGHVVGLDHSGTTHDRDVPQTMFYTIPQKNLTKRTLESEGDIPGVQSDDLGYGAW